MPRRITENNKKIVGRAIEQSREGHNGLLENVLFQLRWRYKYTYAEIIAVFKEQGMIRGDYCYQLLIELEDNLD